jgi:DNA polymerase III epsilon subunit-like protein
MIKSNEISDPRTKNSTRQIGTAAVLDLETTGLSRYFEEIIELAIAVFRYNRVTGRVRSNALVYNLFRSTSVARRAFAVCHVGQPIDD